MILLSLNFWIGTIAGAVICYYFTEFMNSRKAKKSSSKRYKNIQKFRKLLAEQDFTMKHNNVIEIDHGEPVYGGTDGETKISERKVDRAFFFPIPEKYKDILREKSNNSFVQDKTIYFNYYDNDNCLNSNFWGNIEKFERGMTNLGRHWDTATKEELETISVEVAKEIICDMDNGKKRFNSAIFGVDSFNPNNTNVEEYPCVLVNFYKTDYFTYRVFSRYYQAHPLRDLSLDSINKLSYPFLCSFGINIIVVISENDCNAPLENGDIIVVGERSGKVIVNANRLHFTMNEAFCLRDMSINGPSIRKCAERGLVEELRWSNEIAGLTFGDIKFTDFFFCIDVCEMGIGGFVKINIDGKTIEEKKHLLRDWYLESQDGALETYGLKFISMEEAEAFLENNVEKMSDSFALALKSFLRRYRLKLI